MRPCSWIGRSFKWITVTLFWFQKLSKSKKWSGSWNKIHSTHPIQYMFGWWPPHWLGIILQMRDGCCWQFNSHWRQFLSKFSKFIFLEFICLTDKKNSNGKCSWWSDADTHIVLLVPNEWMKMKVWLISSQTKHHPQLTVRSEHVYKQLLIWLFNSWQASWKNDSLKASSS